MHLGNQLENHNEEEFYEDFSSSIFIFDSESNQRPQKPIEKQCSQNKSINFQQRMNQPSQNEPIDPESFLDSILIKDIKQYKDDMQMQKIFKRLPEHQDSEYSQQKESHHRSTQYKRTMDKTEMNRIYTKNYRLKKKQELQSLKEENKFLKQKIDDLTFRLREAQLEINKLKHEELNFSNNFNAMKEECIKELEEVLSTDKASYAQFYDLEQKYKNLVAFSNKPRLDMLNYLMSELLQNLISDQGMYFIQCMENRTGIWRENKSTPLSKLDYEILEILNGPSNENNENESFLNVYRKIFMGNEHIVMREMVKIKTLWKKLYQDYLDIINQGLKMETVYRPMFQKKMVQQKDWILNSLKFKLHFERNKYRKDIRQIRQSWFRQILQGKSNQSTKTQSIMNPQKRCKLQN